VKEGGGIWGGRSWRVGSACRWGREQVRVPVREMSRWAAGWFLRWAERVSRGPFPIFISFSSFLFSVFLFHL
jgi:hypothetical protein